jgi:hypothetical protein
MEVSLCISAVNARLIIFFESVDNALFPQPDAEGMGAPRECMGRCGRCYQDKKHANQAFDYTRGASEHKHGTGKKHARAQRDTLRGGLQAVVNIRQANQADTPDKIECKPDKQ